MSNLSNQGTVETVIAGAQARVTAAGEAVKAGANVAIPIPGDIAQAVTDAITGLEPVADNTVEAGADIIVSTVNRLLDALGKLGKVATG